MGYSTFMQQCEYLNDDKVSIAAESMVNLGLSKLGYKYVIIDDCWSAKDRDQQGLLQSDSGRFPDGMKAMADIIHKLGLKFGLSLCGGT